MLRNELILALITLGTTAFAQAPGVEAPRGYNGLQAGEEAARYNNARRLDAVREQLGLSEWLAVREYSQLDGFYFPYPPLAGGYVDPDLVDPWPLAANPWFGRRPWDIGRQSLGQRYQQTGPNRWESRPIYAEPSLPEPPRPRSTAREF